MSNVLRVVGLERILASFQTEPATISPLSRNKAKKSTSAFSAARRFSRSRITSQETPKKKDDTNFHPAP
jgi:hypothetical protein